MMTPDQHSDIETRLRDDAGMDDALHRAMEDVRQLHIRAGVTLIGSRSGRVVHVNPIDLSEIKAQRDTA
jgi:hypothetical protein